MITQLAVCQIIIILKNYHNGIAADLSKQQVLDADLKVIQRINFNAKLKRVEQAAIYFLIEEARETVLIFSQGSVSVF